LGWRPIYSLKQGLKKTIDWYSKNQDWWLKFKKEAEAFYQLKTKEEKK